MNLGSVNTAIAEAERFLKAAKEWRTTYTLRDPKHYFSAPKEAGFVRRSSMDLTRALAELRKPG